MSKRDKERLDWLTKNGVTLDYIAKSSFDDEDFWRIYYDYKRTPAYGNTPRQAIDEAIKAERKERK